MLKRLQISQDKILIKKQYNVMYICMYVCMYICLFVLLYCIDMYVYYAKVKDKKFNSLPSNVWNYVKELCIFFYNLFYNDLDGIQASLTPAALAVNIENFKCQCC